MAGSRERNRMPYETSKEERFAYGTGKRRSRDRKVQRTFPIGEEVREGYPELGGVEEATYGPGKGWMLPHTYYEGKENELTMLVPLVDWAEAQGVEFTEESLAELVRLLDVGAGGSGEVAAEEEGRFQRIGDLLEKLWR